MRTRHRAIAAGLLVTAGLVGSGATTAHAGSGWQPTGSMSTVHRGHGAALLNDGRVLVVSGFNSITGAVPENELYDPIAGTWSPAAPPLVARHYASTTKLPDGRVLLAGGWTGARVVTNHAEIYDPSSNTWTATGPMGEKRNGHTAVLLDNGKVLVAGGANDARDASATAELYDPAVGTWSLAGSFGEGRENHQSTKLADGRVLMAGGVSHGGGTAYRSSAWIYAPATNTWTETGRMTTPRTQMQGGLLPDGTVLAPGGVNGSGPVASAERFDPQTNSWTAAGIPGVTGNVSYGVMLQDGRFLLTADYSTATPIYDGALLPATAGWSSRYESGASRTLSTLTVLQDGRVLNAGGSDFASAELFTLPTERGATGGAFPETEVEAAVEQDITLTNDGGRPLWIDGTGLAGDDEDDFAIVSDDCGAEALQPDETCVVRVRFSPSAVGARTAELTVDDNAETSSPVILTGTGVAPVDPPVDPPTGPGLPFPPSLPDPRVGPPPIPSPPGPPSCSQPYLTLVGITATGSAKASRVRLSGLATPSLAGRTVTVLRGQTRVGRARVAADGTVATTVRAPSNQRARNVARYRLSIDGVTGSAALKATRRVASAQRSSLSDGRIRVTGRVAGVRRATTLEVRSTPVCGPKVRGVRVRTDRRGRFRVTLDAPPAGVPAVVHRVWLQNRSVTLPIVVTAAR